MLNRGLPKEMGEGDCSCVGSALPYSRTEQTADRP